MVAIASSFVGGFKAEAVPFPLDYGCIGYGKDDLGVVRRCRDASVRETYFPQVRFYRLIANTIIVIHTEDNRPGRPPLIYVYDDFDSST